MRAVRVRIVSAPGYTYCVYSGLRNGSILETVMQTLTVA